MIFLIFNISSLPSACCVPPCSQDKASVLETAIAENTPTQKQHSVEFTSIKALHWVPVIIVKPYKRWRFYVFPYKICTDIYIYIYLAYIFMMSYEFTMISMISTIKKIIPRNLGKSSKFFISCVLATKKGLGITMPNVKIKKVSEEEKKQ